MHGTQAGGGFLYGPGGAQHMISVATVNTKALKHPEGVVVKMPFSAAALLFLSLFLLVRAIKRLEHLEDWESIRV